MLPVSPSALVLVSEVSLALYPILIKTVPVNLSTQLISRFLTFTVLAAIAAPGALGELWSPSGARLSRTLGLGAITLAHVFMSYFAFSALPAGVAMALFYTYPVMNILGGLFFFGERVSVLEGVLVGVAIVGAGLLALGTREGEEEGPKEIQWSGVLAGLGAALTETLMYFAVRTSVRSNPFFNTVELYSGALLGMVGLIIAGAVGGIPALKIQGGPLNWGKMLAFNTLIGFAGYVLRFYTIQKMSTVAFSLLSLVGVIASFVWGLVFVSEVPTLWSIAGSALIVMAAVMTDKKD